MKLESAQESMPYMGKDITKEKSKLVLKALQKKEEIERVKQIIIKIADLKDDNIKNIIKTFKPIERHIPANRLKNYQKFLHDARDVYEKYIKDHPDEFKT